MFRQVELVEHLGESPEGVVKTGMEAFDAFRRALDLYEENLNLAHKFGVIEDVNRRAAALDITHRDIGVQRDTFESASSILAQRGVVGVFEQVHENTTHVVANLASLLEGINESDWPNTGRGPSRGPAAHFAPIMGSITEAAMACHVASRMFDEVNLQTETVSAAHDIGQSQVHSPTPRDRP